MNEDLLTFPGAAIKALDRQVIGGHAVLFTNPWSTDRENEFFTKDTDYDLEDRFSVCGAWHHFLDPTVQEPLGRCSFQVQDEGIYSSLKLRGDEVGKRVFKLAERGELAWSSGSSSHQVRRERVGSANWIARWPITEFSVLPRTAAAEPRAKVTALKSLADATVEPLIAGPEELARGIYVQTVIDRYERVMREFERSQHADAKAEESDYYSALASLANAKCEQRRRQLEKMKG